MEHTSQRQIEELKALELARETQSGINVGTYRTDNVETWDLRSTVSMKVQRRFPC